MLLADLADEKSAPARRVEITGVSADSRSVEPGYLFAALPGCRSDGAHFVGEAARRGARAVLGAAAVRPRAEAVGLPFVPADNPRRSYALAAARFFAVQPQTVVAVTGTNGKTSVASFTEQIWTALGCSAASLGTLGLSCPALGRTFAGSRLTTPDAAEFHAMLAAVAKAGVDRIAVEASSHGLAQHRLDGARLTAAAFTTLGRDHLDYHRTEAAYFAAKARPVRRPSAAWRSCGPAQRHAPLRRAARALPRPGHRLLTYGHEGDVRLVRAQGGVLELVVLGKRLSAGSRMIGRFQVENLLCALALAIGCGADPARAAATLGGVAAAPGRLERVAACANGAEIYVDYAHTPDALRTVLGELRSHVAGALVLVFGCGGDRDPGKRPEMGEIASRLADRVIVTDDNPRGRGPRRHPRRNSSRLSGCHRGRRPPRGDRGGARGPAQRRRSSGRRQGA